ncbi:neutrophil cytosol factor 2 isoform X1 [Arapaima gigas]
MSFVDTIRQWDKAVAFADKHDWSAALKEFLDIQDPNSKIFFNIGCLHLAADQLDAAEKAFDNSICKDEHLAVAFFQRGITFYKKHMFEESASDFQRAYTELRGNQLIDYNLLGLRYKLYACKVLHNLALTQAQLARWDKAQEYLLTALNFKTESKHAFIDQALESILKQKPFDLLEIKAGTLFRPKKRYVAELENKDYMGKAKVLASVVPKDQFSGFAPLQPQVKLRMTLQSCPEELQTGLFQQRRVTFPLPHTDGSSVAFIVETERGFTALLSVSLRLQKGLVPYNYLEPVEITLSSKQEQAGAQSEAIPAAPRGEPPTRPQRRAGSLPPPPPASSFSSTSAFYCLTHFKGEDNVRKEPGCIVKIHFKYTFVITASPGVPYGAVLQRIAEKLHLPLQQIALSYKKGDSNTTEAVEEAEMEDVWKMVRNKRLVLWCHADPTQSHSTEEEDREPRVFGKMVALHAYESSQPEDLQLQCGDVVTVLSKVNSEWLEGQCNGKIKRFPPPPCDTAKKRWF